MFMTAASFQTTSSDQGGHLGWIARPDIDVVLITGAPVFPGGFPPEAMALFDEHIEGFGELFRQLYTEIGTSTVQSGLWVALPTVPSYFACPVPQVPVAPPGRNTRNNWTASTGLLRRGAACNPGLKAWR